MRRHFVLSWSHLVIAGLLAGHLVGCGGPEGPKRDYAEVTGKVTYKNVPLKVGTVMFQPVSGPFASGEIKPDGTYSLKGVVGPNTVMITSREEAPPPAGNAPPPQPKNNIPPAYGTPTSNLKFDVKAGPNTANFDLK